MPLNAKTKRPFQLSTFLTFLLPSLAGLLLFVVPVSYKGQLTIPIALLAGALRTYLVDWIPTIVTGVIILTTLITILAKIGASFITRNAFLNGLFNISPVWCCIRFAGAAFVIATYFKIGPAIIWNQSTGGMVLYDLLPVLFSVFIFAGLLLPLLMNFGLLEMVGALLSKVMRPLFLLPGRSAVNCLASWLGDGSVGILITSKQYETGFYTAKEAVTIGTTFSTVSITFTLVVIAQVGLAYLFVPFFLTVTFAILVAALIVPRLPPLSWKKDSFIDGSARKGDENIIPEGMTSFSWGLQQALEKAEQTQSPIQVIKEGAKTATDMVFGVLPVVMGIGTISLLVANYTPVFNYLGMPFVPLLKLLHIPEAVKASTTMVVGFADMFVPSILAASIKSELTRFVIAGLSLTQLIYLSEVGALMLGSKIPVSLWELFVIFLLRTLVTLPIIAGIAHLIF